MSSYKIKNNFSRRKFLQGMRWAPALFIPSPLFGLPMRAFSADERPAALPFSDFRVLPRYPAKSPLDDVFRQVIPGADEFITEKYVFEIMPLLAAWGAALKSSAPGLNVLAKFVDPSMEGTPLAGAQERRVRSAHGIEVLRRTFANEPVLGRERFLDQVKQYFAN